MERNNSQDHPNHPVDDAAAEQYRRRTDNNNNNALESSQPVNNHNGGQHIQPHPYFPMHNGGLMIDNQPQHYQQQNYLQHHYNNSNQSTAWQWMSVAIPPPPPPPPLHNPFLPSTGSISSPAFPSQAHQGESRISDDQPKRRKRRWGPGVNEEQTVSEQQTGQVVAKDNSNSPKKLKEENNSTTDSALDAINALSTLESRWKAPPKKKRNRRKRGKKMRKDNPPTNNNIDVEEIMDNVWIDVEDVVKIINPSRSAKQENIEDSGKDLESFDVMDFPPLKSETTEEEKTELDLNALDTAELKSYADVLMRALGSGSKNQSSDDEDSKMDISDEEESSVDTTAPETSSKDKAGGGNVRHEKEKRALKLAELKAKAKLANAKLRMAIQRKALGNTAKDAKTSLAATANGRSTPTYTATTHQTKRPWHASTSNSSSGLRDISAMLSIHSLSIPDVSLTGSYEMVRFIDSVYDLSSEDDDSSWYEEEDKEVEVALPNNESQKKSHQSLKQQLQLAKLRLEIKRKEQLLLEKKRNTLVIEQTTDSSSLQSATCLVNISEDCNDSMEGKSKPIDKGSDLTISTQEKTARLEQLKRRQKELKQKNEVSNLKNLINRQRQLLRTQGQELTASSAQLESVVSDITSKQNLLDESKKRQEEMSHRKKIMEGMMLRATEKLMTARKALGHHKQRSLTN